MADLSVRYPRVVIEFCTACKWNLRAAYVRRYSRSHFPISCLSYLKPARFRPGSHVFPRSLKMFPLRTDPAVLSSETMNSHFSRVTLSNEHF
jgi:hypothetical protein